MWSMKTSWNAEVLGKIFEGLSLIHFIESAYVKQSSYFSEGYIHENQPIVTYVIL